MCAKLAHYDMITAKCAHYDMITAKPAHYDMITAKLAHYYMITAKLAHYDMIKPAHYDKITADSTAFLRHAACERVAHVADLSAQIHILDLNKIAKIRIQIHTKIYNDAHKKH